MSTAIATRNISHTELRKGYERLQGLQTRLARLREKAQDTTEKVVRTVEVGSSALAFGVVQGRMGSVEIMGVPLDLGAGVALNLLGYFGAAGKYSDHLNNFGDGALAAYLCTVGKGVGASMALKSGGAPKSVTKGIGLSAEEIADAAVNG